MAENQQALGAEIMKEVKRYNDGMGCTRRQLVDNILILISQSRLSPASAAPVVEAILRDAGAIIIVNEGTDGARVEIRFAELEDAQRLHETLAQIRAAATAAPVEQSENESCSHWREGDSDNCVWCGDDLGPTTETDVNEGAR